ncbi:MAG: glycosyltransferase family 4 protein [candidate division FCPU426 bacterium]
MRNKIKVNIISESEGFKAQGVHTAFVDMVDAMSKMPGIEILVNSDQPCDILHAHTFGPRYWKLKRHYPGRRIMTAHVVPGSFIGSLALAKYWAPISDWYLKVAYNSAEVVLCVAPQVKRDLAAIGVKSRLEVLTNPVSTERFFPSPKLRTQGRRLLKLRSTEKICLSAGQIQPRKGVAEFIAAARALPEIQFVWLGGRPFKRLTAGFSELNKAMESAPANVHFAGVFELEQMPALYNAADLFFFPSYQENCALAINEAMACGIPMLLRDNPEYAELYGPCYLAAKDPAGYAAKITDFFKDGKLRASLRLRSSKAAERFNVKNFSEKLAGLYKDLAKP